jgi:hypothetical protein
MIDGRMYTPVEVLGCLIGKIKRPRTSTAAGCEREGEEVHGFFVQVEVVAA